MVLRLALMIADFGGAFVIASCMNLITAEATNGVGISAKRWAWVRRTIYAMVALALFTLGLFRMEQEPPPAVDGIAHLVVVFAIVFFPLMRAFGFISQDTWVPDRVDAVLDKLHRWNGNGSAG